MPVMCEFHTDFSSTDKRLCIFFLSVRLTHWGRVTQICVSKLTIIGSDNGLSPGRRQAIIWTNAGILLIRTLGTNFSEILGEIHSFSFTKMHLKMSSAKWRLFGLHLNELNGHGQILPWRDNVAPYITVIQYTPRSYSAIDTLHKTSISQRAFQDKKLNI